MTTTGSSSRSRSPRSPPSARSTSTATATATGTATQTATATATATQTATATATTTATQTATATATATGTATPTTTATPTRIAQPLGQKVGICHRTGSATNPWVFVEVSENAVPAPQNHGDVIGVSSRADCPQPPPVPAACASNRGNVGVSTVQEGPGRLRVTVTANNTPGLPPNQITELHFGPTRNGLVDVEGQTGRSGNFTVTLSPAVPSVTFLVRRESAGQATTIHLDVVDQCGRWRTIIGGGPNAF